MENPITLIFAGICLRKSAKAVWREGLKDKAISLEHGHFRAAEKPNSPVPFL